MTRDKGPGRPLLVAQTKNTFAPIFGRLGGEKRSGEIPRLSRSFKLPFCFNGGIRLS